MHDTGKLIVFVRAPEKGTVKTRLSRHLDEGLVLAVYRGFVERCLDVADQAEINPAICYCPVDKEDLVREWLGAKRGYCPQSGNDLGERMFQAFVRFFAQGCTRAVLIGSDVPDMTPDHLLKAFLILESHDAVLGPVFDGGYWLIGFNRDKLDRSVFDGITWGTDTVFEATRTRMAALGMNTGLLEPLRDVDTLEDLLQSPAGSCLLRNLLSGPAA